MPKAQPEHRYGFGLYSHTCVRCGIVRRQPKHPNGVAKSVGPEWSHDLKTWTTKHTACPGKKPMSEEAKKPTVAESYPECTKLSAHSVEIRNIMDFLTWLIEEGKVDVADSFMSANNRTDVNNHQKLVSLYLGIDSAKVEDERRKMLEEQRSHNKETAP